MQGGTSKASQKRSATATGSSSHKEGKKPKVDLTVNKDVLDGIEKLQQEGGRDFEVSFVL